MPSEDREVKSLSLKEAPYTLTAASAGSMRNQPMSYDLFRSGRRGSAQPTGPGATLSRWVDSFRRDPHTHISRPTVIVHGVEPRNSNGGERTSGDAEEGMPLRDNQWGHYFDLHAAAVSTANPLLARELKGRHLQMIAIGGSIGV